MHFLFSEPCIWSRSEITHHPPWKIKLNGEYLRKSRKSDHLIRITSAFSPVLCNEISNTREINYDVIQRPGTMRCYYVTPSLLVRGIFCAFIVRIKKLIEMIYHRFFFFFFPTQVFSDERIHKASTYKESKETTYCRKTTNGQSSGDFFFFY